MPDVLSFPASDAPQTVGATIALYLVHTRHEQNPRTYADRKLVLDEFTAMHGALTLATARPFHLRLWIDGQRDRWKSDWTRKRVAGTVQAAMNWAVKLGIVDRNPFRGVSCPAGERGQPMEPAEFQAMLRATTAVFRRFLIFLRYTGCRPGEAANAEWVHLDTGRACIELDKHKTFRKTRKVRRIMLHPVVLKLLAWIRRHKPHERITTTQTYFHVSGKTEHLQEAVKQIFRKK